MIIDSAIRIADQRGVEALTMRLLAAALGVEAMSLYSHFASKDELLDAISARLLLSLEFPAPAAAPRTRLVGMAESYRRLGHRHPNLFPLLVLRPQCLEAALRTTEYGLAAFHDAGLTRPKAIRAQRTLLSFVRGYTLWEIGWFLTGYRPAPGAPPKLAAIDDLARLDPGRFPHVSAAARDLLNFVPDEDFHKGVLIVLKTFLPRRKPGVPATARRSR